MALIQNPWSCSCGDTTNCKPCRQRALRRIRRSKARNGSPSQTVRISRSRGGSRPRACKLSIPHDVAILAYIAGLVDGEGCLTTSRSSYLATSDKPRQHPWLVKISMTDAGVIHWLHATLGGNLTVSRPPAPLKTVFNWTISAQNDVHAFVVAVRPFLRVKAHRADACLSDIAARQRAWNAMPVLGLATA